MAGPGVAPSYPGAVAPLAGYTVALSADPARPDVSAELESHGARVLAFGWSPAESDAVSRRIVELVTTEAIDVLAVIGAAVAHELVRVADELECRDRLRAALAGRVLGVCSGAEAAATLLAAGLPVVRAEAQLVVAEIVEQVSAFRTSALPVAGHVVEVRGQAAVVDGELIPLSGSAIALLRELASRPGQVFSRDDLVTLLPGEGSDGHAVEVAIARLRAALGDPKIVTTVLKRGYRLAM